MTKHILVVFTFDFIFSKLIKYKWNVDLHVSSHSRCLDQFTRHFQHPDETPNVPYVVCSFCRRYKHIIFLAENKVLTEITERNPVDLAAIKAPSSWYVFRPEHFFLFPSSLQIYTNFFNYIHVITFDRGNSLGLLTPAARGWWNTATKRKVGVCACHYPRNNRPQ
jgi:hypothetical protein